MFDRELKVFYTAQKWSFLLRTWSVNVTKSSGNCGFRHIYWENPLWKTSFFVQCYKEALLRNLVMFTGKHLGWSLFLIKLQALLKRDFNTGKIFLWIFWNFSEELFLGTSANGWICTLKTPLKISKTKKK